MNKAGKISNLVVAMAAVGTLYATVKDVENRVNGILGIENSENVKNQTTTQTAEKLTFLKDEKGEISLEEKEEPKKDGGDGKTENENIQTDLPAQIKAFVNQNRTFVNKIKTNKNCINLYNVFVTIEKDANNGLSADDISTRFNQAFKNDNPSGEALKYYETAYGLFSKAFKTDKVAFVNPNPQKPTEEIKITSLPYLPEYEDFVSEEDWKKMNLEEQKYALSGNDFDAEKAVKDYMVKIQKENKEMEQKLKNQ